MQPQWAQGDIRYAPVPHLRAEVTVLDLDVPRDDLLAGLADAELAFLAIAGRGAEDGRLQGLLATLGVPFTDSGVLASAVGMHELHAKEVAAAAGVRVPRGTRVAPDADADSEAARIAATLGLPRIVEFQRGTGRGA